MSYPSEGTESLYRNNAVDVSKNVESNLCVIKGQTISG